MNRSPGPSEDSPSRVKHPRQPNGTPGASEAYRDLEGTVPGTKPAVDFAAAQSAEPAREVAHSALDELRVTVWPRVTVSGNPDDPPGRVTSLQVRSLR